MVPGREVISTEKAPGAVGPYSQAIKHGKTLYVSGQVALVPEVSQTRFSTQKMSCSAEHIQKKFFEDVVNNIVCIYCRQSSLSVMA
jgi:enamine deaminase RidA (YjgF/YER057c/UK114 family)